MKILIFNWRDITHTWSGGSEKYVHEIARVWKKQGHEITLICGGYKGALSREEIDGIEIRRFGSTHSIYFILPFYYLLKLRQEKYDVVIENAYGITFFSVLYSPLPKILFIHHDHKLPWQTEWPSLIARLGVWIEHTIVPRLYRHVPIITPSHKSQLQLKRLGYSKVFVVSPGSEQHYLQQRLRKTSSPTILYLGRLRRYKRVEILLKMFQSLLVKIPHLRLIIAGTGQDMSRIRHLVSLHPNKAHIELIGYVSESEKMQLLASSWVLAFPSQIEGWGLVTLEAASCGTPTVGFNVSGVSEAIKHNQSGFVVNTETEFKNSLLKILSDVRLRNRLHRHARRWAATFTWRKSADKFMAVIKDAVGVSEEVYGRTYFASFWRGASRRSFHPTYNLRIAYITKYLNPQSILDVGCGTGLMVKLLRDRGVDAYGLDISQTALDMAPVQLKPYLTTGNILKLMHPNNAFDTVICIDVLEHIPSAYVAQAISECARIARNSVFFNITSLEDWLFIHSDPTHVTKLWSWQWKRNLESQLTPKWKIHRPFILPFIQHGTFVAKKVI